MASRYIDAQASLQVEYPPKADLRKMIAQNPLPAIAPGLIDPDSMGENHLPTEQVNVALDRLNAALVANDATALERCFFAPQAYWKDQLALTYHLRTFSEAGVIAAALLRTKALRGVADIAIDGVAQFIPAAPSLQFIDCGIVFRTASPAATCKGKVILLPVKSGESISWKIWVLSTFLESLDLQPEDEGLLHLPGRPLDGLEAFETDVFIIGGGNAAISLAARLKALGVESVMAERNARVGDNWALRYDCMRFHIPTAFCDLPFMGYDSHLRGAHMLTRDELAAQLRRYVAAFNLNIITSAEIQSTSYDKSAQTWKIRFKTPAGSCTVISKQLVLATGIRSQEPNMPHIADSHLYRGISMHSTQYENARRLQEQGVKSVLIIGSANTAFDILEDTHSSDLQSTMVTRSPTYIVPVEYLCNPRSLGAYDHSVPAADSLFMTIPACIDAQFARNLLSQQASEEPDRYARLARAGFDVLDSRDPSCLLASNLLERAGGHYVDVGGTKLLEEGKAGIKSAEPIAYTPTGLLFSDGSTLDADAVIWCTGFSDANVRDTTARILGSGEMEPDSRDLLGPQDIAARLDATWGVDVEGEIRGMWKRHVRMENFWVAGGFTQQHRWHSRTMALQIKAALEGVLPSAYRDTPRGRLGSVL
ncbi:FAD/NAD(P)-binding domain-containing protein [Aspergillus heteromorphus CBS 117.55]|uniref:FAD/NAD(P)-binding domain-containing protein n=1 Tax=Aspergillus heteromorphus CBS 117.55 TaxID=1448321 RepID=A0A317VL17_9EURO|nr:FAD/NAD(P)-binding domain-containing protein [Aspergillus heteromorphus CBS 117.55]PWY75074.1 FAD/NAD(P)-binding domain-containing protein [Aspergillus heteromorphus CBS 117.55]